MPDRMAKQLFIIVTNKIDIFLDVVGTANAWRFSKFFTYAGLDRHVKDLLRIKDH